MQLRHYLRMILRGWWIIVLAALSGLILALSASYVEPSRYRTSARLIVSPNPQLINSGQFIYSIDTLDKRSIVTTYSEVLNSSRLFGETGMALGIPESELSQYNHSTVVIPEANILELFVDGPNPEITALLANNLSQRSIDYVREVYQVYDLDVLDPAAVPAIPFAPRPMRDAALATALGVIFGAVLAILQEQLRLPLEALRRRNTLDQASQAYNRRTFEQLLKQSLAKRENGSMGLIALEGIEDVMEMMPPAATQRVLRQVRATLRHELRGSDVIGRWNQTTFAVMLIQTPEQAAAKTFERIREALTKPIALGFEDEHVILSPYTGIVPHDGTVTPSELIEMAEAALQRSARSHEKTAMLPRNAPSATT